MKNLAFVLCVLCGALAAACSGASAPSSPTPVDGGGEPVDATAGHAPVAAPMGVAPDTADGYDGLDDADLNGGPEIANASANVDDSEFRVRNLRASCGLRQRSLVDFTWSLPQGKIYGIRIRVGLDTTIGGFRNSGLWTSFDRQNLEIWQEWVSRDGAPGSPVSTVRATIGKAKKAEWPKTDGGKMKKTRFTVETKRWENSGYVWGHEATALLKTEWCRD